MIDESRGPVRRPSGDLAAALRARFRFLLVGSMLVVAIAFGMSFYVGLVSGQSAIASQIPELEEVVSRLKGSLIVNTFGFGAVLAASLFLLSHLVTSRIFRPLETVERGIHALGRGEFPARTAADADGPFAGFAAGFDDTVEALRDREREEYEALKALLDAHPSVVNERIAEMIERKRSSIAGADGARASADDAGDPLFMQPA
ncbi:MAG: hypothetical protein JW876_08585 [Candidatus Krumholzibacteriota bacterium]|nr:hypothetical protein [Candidatus Krumholzibacteriota bacterium]